MVSALDCVKLSAQIYKGIGFDHYDAGDDDGICWGIKYVEDFDVITFRGSDNLTDWFHDLMANPIPTRIGTVHQGFYLGMERIWNEYRSLRKNPAVLTGHSLGAARASILSALMITDGQFPALRYVFGEPKPGYEDLAKIVCHVSGGSYVNHNGGRNDPVTDLPVTVPPFEYVHATPLIQMPAKPSLLQDLWGPFNLHHVELYETSIAGVAGK